MKQKNKNIKIALLIALFGMLLSSGEIWAQHYAYTDKYQQYTLKMNKKKQEEIAMIHFVVGKSKHDKTTPEDEEKEEQEECIEQKVQSTGKNTTTMNISRKMPHIRHYYYGHKRSKK